MQDAVIIMNLLDYQKNGGCFLTKKTLQV